MALIFKGTWAVAFAILEGMLLAVGVGLLGRALLGLPGRAARLAAAAARRVRPARVHEPRRQPLADGRARDADRARGDARGHAGHRPDQRPARRRERHRRARDGAVRRHRPRRRADPARRGDSRAARLDGVAAVAHDRDLPGAAALGENAPWPAAGTRHHGRAARSTSRFTAGDLRTSAATRVAVSHVFAETGDLKRRRHVHRAPGRHDPPHAARRRDLQRAAGLGDVVTGATPPAPIAAIFVAAADAPRPRRAATASRCSPATSTARRVHAAGQRAGLGRLDDHRPGRAVRGARADQHRGDGDRRAPRRAGDDPPARRHARPGRCARSCSRRSRPSSSRSPRARPIVAISVHGVPLGLTGVPLAIPRRRCSPRVTAGAAALGCSRLLVSTRLALRRLPRSAMRAPRSGCRRAGWCPRRAGSRS